MVALHRGITEAVRPPRGLLLPWPFGHPFGEPGARAQQRSVILAALSLLDSATPGLLVEAPWRWRRERYPDPLAPGSAPPLPDRAPGSR